MNRAATHGRVELPDVGRHDLPAFLAASGRDVGVEVGVECGLYSEVLLQAGLAVYSVDAWQAYGDYRKGRVTQAKADRCYAETLDRLARYPRSRVIRQFSVDAARAFADQSLDWVYLDGAHDFASVRQDIAAWLPKIRLGGVMAGHDYVHIPRDCDVVEVKQAVDAYTHDHHVSPWYVLGRKDIRHGETRDKPRSWFWITR